MTKEGVMSYDDLIHQWWQLCELVVALHARLSTEGYPALSACKKAVFH